MSWCSSASSVRSMRRHDHVQRAQRLVLERAQLVLEAEPVGLARHQPNLPVT